MVRIGISQRVDQIPGRDERRDALDQAWTPLLQALGITPIPIPNSLTDPIAFVEGAGITGLILSGGNDLCSTHDSQHSTTCAPERDRTEAALLDHAEGRGLPVLAVCRGMQMLVSHYGGTLAPRPGHVRTQHHLRLAPPAAGPWWHDLLAQRLQADSGPVNSYHDFAIANAPASLVPFAYAEDDSVEALAHRDFPMVGILWHPERAPQYPADGSLIAALFDPGAPR